MKVEVEYIIRKRATIECNDATEIHSALQQTNWVSGNQLIVRWPEITSKRILDDNITRYKSDDGCYYTKPGVEKKDKGEDDVRNPEEWAELLKKKAQRIKDKNPAWDWEKCKYVARHDMPDFPSVD